ncbi:hypothetical protein Slin15195_G075950 [Septoria linicola]|uniref:Uncharacterized protein n=1 Tax=Septoria linicola TaxID=215465 RepID=A0A9Q9AYW9_9PEZI|nr:hypothetical protein Slin15195_G075950 [Septoria linicola]
MEGSPLSKLPAELRLLIYEYTFEACSPVTFHLGTRDVRRAKDIISIKSYPNARAALDLTATCQQIRREALPVYYSKTRFDFWIEFLSTESRNDMKNDYMCSKQELRAWLRTYASHATRIQHIGMYFGYWMTYGGNTDGDINDWAIQTLPIYIQDMRDLFRQDDLTLTAIIDFQFTAPVLDDPHIWFSLELQPHDKAQARRAVSGLLANAKAEVDQASTELDDVYPRAELRIEQRRDLVVCRDVLDRLLTSFEATDYS